MSAQSLKKDTVAGMTDKAFLSPADMNSLLLPEKDTRTFTEKATGDAYSAWNFEINRLVKLPGFITNQRADYGDLLSLMKLWENNQVTLPEYVPVEDGSLHSLTPRMRQLPVEALQGIGYITRIRSELLKYIPVFNALGVDRDKEKEASWLGVVGNRLLGKDTGGVMEEFNKQIKEIRDKSITLIKSYIALLYITNPLLNPKTQSFLITMQAFPSPSLGDSGNNEHSHSKSDLRRESMDVDFAVTKWKLGTATKLLAALPNALRGKGA